MKKKEYVMDAIFDEETYHAYMSGQAVDNNGLRSPKGAYWPKQPKYRRKSYVKEQLKRESAEIAAGATDYIVFNIGLPMLRRIFREEVYPAVAGKVRNWLHPAKEDVPNKMPWDAEAESNCPNVIRLDEYRKRA